MSKLTRSLFVSLFALCIGSLMMMPAPPAKAQSVSLGADMVNRYVWRGTTLSDKFSVQPSLSFSQSGFTVGAWGSFASAEADEADLYASYSFDTGGSGTVSVGVTDYYFPSTGTRGNFFDYEDEDPGEENAAHTIEPNISYTGPESFPISLYASIYATNDDDNPIWLEASYPFSVKDVSMSVAIGGTPVDDGGEYLNDSDVNPKDQGGVAKLSLSASKSIEVTDEFSLPVFATYYVSPYNEQSYILFGFSL